MVSRVNISFRVRHQAQHPSGGIAQTRNVIGRAVGVHRIIAKITLPVNITISHQPCLAHLLLDLLIGKTDFSLAVSDGQIDSLARVDKNTFIRPRLQVNPAILELT